MRLFRGVANIGEKSNAFFCMAKEAAERSSVFLADPDGTKNTDIITNGIADSFDAMTNFTVKTLAPVLNWSMRDNRTSWQQIMNCYSKRSLTEVNGDE